MCEACRVQQYVFYLKIVKTKKYNYNLNIRKADTYMYSQEKDLQGRGFINIFSRWRTGFHSWAKSFSQRVNLLSALPE